MDKKRFDDWFDSVYGTTNKIFSNLNDNIKDNKSLSDIIKNINDAKSDVTNFAKEKFSGEFSKLSEEEQNKFVDSLNNFNSSLSGWFGTTPHKYTVDDLKNSKVFFNSFSTGDDKKSEDTKKDVEPTTDDGEFEFSECNCCCNHKDVEKKCESDNKCKDEKLKNRKSIISDLLQELEETKYDTEEYKVATKVANYVKDVLINKKKQLYTLHPASLLNTIPYVDVKLPADYFTMPQRKNDSIYGTIVDVLAKELEVTQNNIFVDVDTTAPYVTIRICLAQ